MISAKCIILTAASAAVFSGLDRTSVSDYADLKGKTVCTRINTVSFRWLEETMPCSCRLESGENNDDMYDKYFAGQCDALVYDFPLSAEKLHERSKFDAKAIAKHKLVGEVERPKQKGHLLVKVVDGRISISVLSHLKSCLVPRCHSQRRSVRLCNPQEPSTVRAAQKCHDRGQPSSAGPETSAQKEVVRLRSFIASLRGSG